MEEGNSGKAGKTEAKPRPRLRDNYRYGSGFVMLLYGFINPDSYERTFVSHGRGERRGGDIDFYDCGERSLFRAFTSPQSSNFPSQINQPRKRQKKEAK